MADYSPYLVAHGENPASSTKQNNLILAIQADMTSLQGSVAALPSAADQWAAADETWSYASATTFTISGDKSGKYTGGMRIKLTQAATVKFFTVVSASYLAPSTTVTVYGHGTYTLANSAISSPYYAAGYAPVGFPFATGDTGEYKVSAQSASHGFYLLCDGTAVSRTTYANLFALLGTNFGSGDGSTTFNLPDARGRVPVLLGTHADVSSLGGNDGVAVANRRPKHNHPNSLTVAVDNNPTGTTSSGAIDAHANNASPGTRNVSGTIGPAGTNPVDAPAYLVIGSLFVHI